MGNHLNKPICIDFYGLPGCGKSTLSHLVSQKLCGEGLEVKEVSYDMDHGNGFLQRSWKKCFSTIKLISFHPCMFWHLSKILSTNGIPLFGKLYFKHIVNLSYKICALKGNTTIILFDEGFCQAILSISVNNDGIRNDCYDSLLDAVACDRRVINVYVKAHSDIALARIRMRNDGQSRFDNLSDDVTKSELVKMEILCGSLPRSIVVENNNSEKIKKLVDQIATGISKEIIS